MARMAWRVVPAALLLAGCGSSMSASDDAGLYGPSGGAYEGGYYEGGYAPDGDGSGETYEDYGENPWTETTDDAQATFAVDVDTGSYTVMRRYLRETSVPPSASVRVEEYVNYFDYGYAPPVPRPLRPGEQQRSEAVAIHLEAAAPVDGDVVLLRVGLKARELPAAERGPANLVFLVDVSGSMADASKLPLVKRSLAILLDELRPDDTVGLVTYAGSTGVALEPTAAAERRTILGAIERLDAGGSTYGEGGLRTAYALAEEHFRAGGINRVILCTDGDFNVGVTGRGLVELIASFRDRGITLSTLGFGQGNYNDRDMEALADRGDGNYAYIDSEAEARRVLVDKLLSTLAVVAKDAKVQLTFDPAVVLRYRLVGYENRAVADQDYVDDGVDGGELGSGHEVTALLELQLTGQAPEAATLVDVGVRYQPPEGGESTEVREALALADVLDDPALASADFRFAAAVAEFARILKRGDKSEDPDFAGLKARAAAALGPGEPADRLEFLQLIDLAASRW